MSVVVVIYIAYHLHAGLKFIMVTILVLRRNIRWWVATPNDCAFENKLRAKIWGTRELDEQALRPPLKRDGGKERNGCSGMKPDPTIKRSNHNMHADEILTKPIDINAIPIVVGLGILTFRKPNMNRAKTRGIRT
jgi:hypothetical protein